MDPRRAQFGGRPQSSKAPVTEIDDDDFDELSNDVPCSSPYFTQPTQIVDRATQPTQIINRKTLKAPSSPPAPSTPSTAIEVPASSPFQPKGQAKHLIESQKQPELARTIGSLIAPAGTSFRPPAVKSLLRRANGPSTNKKNYLEISDDDLSEDYKKHDSSDDGDIPTRGDIRPSFIKDKTAKSTSKRETLWPLKADIALTDIRDIRLRHLTHQVYKIVQEIKPEITIQACKDALQKDVSWRVSKAVDVLTGRPAKSQLPIKLDYMTGNGSKPSSRSKSSTGPGRSQNTLRSFLHVPASTNSSRSSSQNSFSHTNNSSSTSNHPPSVPSIQSTQSTLSSASTRGLKSNNKLRRKRLVQGRRKSPTPPEVFSLPSSPPSSITTPIRSEFDSPALMSGSGLSPDSDAVQKPRRRLVRGRRNVTPSIPAVDSDSDPDTDTDILVTTRSLKRAAAALGNDVQAQSDAPARPEKRAKRQQTDSGARSRKRKSEEDLAALAESDSIPRQKKAKSNSNPQSLSRNQKAYEGLEPIYNSLDSDNDETPEDLVDGVEEDNGVLNYLNSCTAEELGRMTGMVADAKLMVSSRPFKSLIDAEKVYRKDKSKSKTKRRPSPVGEVIVEKLTSWFQACDAATAVITECEKRGVALREAMSTWPLDRNGEPKRNSESDSETLPELPISKKPELMSQSIELKSYQLVGVNWMSLLHSKGYSGILADDMGLGKTCQVIAFIAHLVTSKREPDTRAPWPNLVVVPSSTYENWLSEFEKFAPGIDVLAYYGAHRRDIDPRASREYHVVLTTYSQIDKREEDLEWLQKLKPYAAIFDEGHKLKNQKALVYQQMMQVPTKWRLILSGTPVQNNLKELLTLLHFIEPSLFEEQYFERLSTIFETKVANKDVHNFAALAEGRVGRARTVMAPFILQRRKDDVLDLAKKVERIEIVDMHPLQKVTYDQYKDRYLLPKDTKGTKAAKPTREAHPYMQLRKAAIHHQLFRHHFTDEKVRDMVNILWKNCSEEELGVQSKEDRHKALLLQEMMTKSDFQLHLWCKDFPKYISHLDIPDRSWEESPKVQKFLELIRGYIKTGDRALVFSRFEMVIDILRETLHSANIPYCELTGAMETAERFPECQRFTENTDIPVFLLTTGAGGTGLNLTAANKIILFDQSDNPQDDVQASNRAHRIGQTRDVEVVRIITRNSVERFIYNSCVKKLMLAARVERDHGAEDDEESVEEQCRKLMLLEEEDHAGTDVEAVAPSQEA
ncbi:SNF2 family N-terminal domain-containing protein [Durotheca rogersii]|uniref:SNF2 family N-terminal domain-containing protein n=1 Tax=Durotheca rogersii TaxID=419775 RepID=UPI00221FCE07|nr:SNF2 family N-terminal domain-containing protein [Durotheca rogersii]KAI5867043.1 SNF2 family N-terminal domain-containing protein [Durotheca rogersii]